jgi:hypothetical protein
VVPVGTVKSAASVGAEKAKNALSAMAEQAPPRSEVRNTRTPTVYSSRSLRCRSQTACDGLANENSVVQMRYADLRLQPPSLRPREGRCPCADINAGGRSSAQRVQPNGTASESPRPFTSGCRGARPYADEERDELVGPPRRPNAKEPPRGRAALSQRSCACVTIRTGCVHR